MSIDMEALVHALRDDPVQRAALRDVLGVDDVDVRGALTELASAQSRTESRVEGMAHAVEELAQAQTRTEASRSSPRPRPARRPGSTS